MSIISNPMQRSPERAFSLQKYLLLHSQHDALQKHLDSLSNPISTASTSPSRSPTRCHSRHSSISSSPRSSFSSPSSPPQQTSIPTHSAPNFSPQFTSHRSRHDRRFSLPPILDEAVMQEVEEEEEKLINVNQQIKSTLTDLLNCESVRADERYRTWVQSRLMDAERELREGRRGSLSGVIGERRRQSIEELTFSA
jgi:hypothetical protein